MLMDFHLRGSRMHNSSEDTFFVILALVLAVWTAASGHYGWAMLFALIEVGTTIDMARKRIMAKVDERTSMLLVAIASAKKRDE